MNEIIGTNASETLRGTTGDDLITALDGNDVVRAGNGDDFVDGGLGDDNLRDADVGHDIFIGGEGNDIIRAENGDDLIFGDDVAFDFVEGAVFSYDLVRLREVISLDGTVTEVLREARQNGEVQYNDIVSINALDSADLIHVLEVDDTFLDAGEGLGIDDGDDTISTQKRIDGDEQLAIAINDGNPDFNASNGFSFTLDNIEVSDVETITGASFVVELKLGEITVSTLTFLEADLVSLNSGATFSISADDTAVFDNLVLSAGNNTSFSLRGFDLQLGQLTMVESASGNDNIQAGEGNDTVFGGLGDDIITGNSGDDVITGGGGSDTLTGGSGHDTFVYGQEVIGNPADIITDFQIGFDKFDVSGLGLGDNLFANGFLGVSEITASGFTLNLDLDGGGDGFAALAIVSYGFGQLTDFTAAGLESTLLA
ncbi:MAG: calcium-binding protein [Chloroflexaceae bacterium]|nr:calcium-binding protein [Chloroflexaceae bacterium]